MYIPKHFAMSPAQVAEVLADAPAGDLITVGPDGLSATFVPMLYDPFSRSLIGHLARVNDQWQHTGEALFVVHGPEHYVESDWLSTPEAGSVPTWNYVTVQAKGTFVAHDDPEWTLSALRRLTAAHGDDSLNTMTPDAIQRLLRAIVGVEITGVRLVGKAKMSQNKPPEVIEQVIDGLRESGGDETAEWMAEVSLPRAEAKAAKLAAIRSGQRRSLD